LAADVVEKGILLTGGGALLKNFDKLLHEITGLPITIAEDPLSSVVMGSEKALDSIDILKHT
jgi:rod shape-determining protein MreB